MHFDHVVVGSVAETGGSKELGRAHDPVTGQPTWWGARLDDPSSARIGIRCPGARHQVWPSSPGLPARAGTSGTVQAHVTDVHGTPLSGECLAGTTTNGKSSFNDCAERPQRVHHPSQRDHGQLCRLLLGLRRGRSRGGAGDVPCVQREDNRISKPSRYPQIARCKAGCRSTPAPAKAPLMSR